MKEIKIYLDEEDYRKLKIKAGSGRGCVQDYIRKVCQEDICFLDNNIKILLKALNLNST